MLDSSADLNDRIIALIEQNGRSSYREIAKTLGISERQVGIRLRRLIADDVIRMITVVDAFALGFEIIMTIGVQVADRPAADVAMDLAKLPSAIAVALMTGQYEIEMMVALRNHADLERFITNDVAAIKGIRALWPSQLLDVPKYETGASPVNLTSGGLEIPDTDIVDEGDRTIIKCLWENASETNENIGHTMGVTEATIRKRVNRLRNEGLMHITAIRNVAIGEQMVFASVGLEIDRRKRSLIISRLCALRQVHLVANVFGRYDILAQVLVQNTVELADFLSQFIQSIPGVRRTDCAEAMKLIKFDYRWRVAGKPRPKCSM